MTVYRPVLRYRSGIGYDLFLLPLQKRPVVAANLYAVVEGGEDISLDSRMEALLNLAFIPPESCDI